MEKEFRAPTAAEIEKLVAYLPRLYAPGFQPVERWEGGTRNRDGVLQLPWPVYHPLVVEFFGLLGADAWLDRTYDPSAAARMLAAEGLVERASLEQIRTMLTYCVRGERFADGHWADMLTKGHIRRLLTRLQAL